MLLSYLPTKLLKYLNFWFLSDSSMTLKLNVCPVKKDGTKLSNQINVYVNLNVLKYCFCSIVHKIKNIIYLIYISDRKTKIYPKHDPM